MYRVNFEYWLMRLSSYWDWALDWQDPFSSPVFSPDTGFGGNGDRQSISLTCAGYCISDVLHLGPR